MFSVLLKTKSFLSYQQGGKIQREKGEGEYTGKTGLKYDNIPSYKQQKIILPSFPSSILQNILLLEKGSA